LDAIFTERLLLTHLPNATNEFWGRLPALQFSIEKEQKSSTPPDREMELEQNLL
jgi:hypothetical protein